jgi:hypothetical protein
MLPKVPSFLGETLYSIFFLDPGCFFFYTLSSKIIDISFPIGPNNWKEGNFKDDCFQKITGP